MSLVFFTDRYLGTRFPDILAVAGLNVERHRDHFAPDCSDKEWLEAVGERGRRGMGRNEQDKERELECNWSRIGVRHEFVVTH